MADFRAIVRDATGKHEDIPNGNNLLVGNGIKTTTGNLTLTAAASIIIASAMSFNSGIGIASAGGAANFDWSSSSGTFATGTGTVSLNGNTTVAAAKTLGTTGSGNINLPNNGSARFNVEGVAVSANVTAANLTELTGGGATTLHTHAGSTTAQVTDTGLTLWGTPSSGEVGYMTGTDTTLAKAKADSTSTADFYGVYSGTAGSVVLSGAVGMLFDAGLTLTSGDRVYVSAATAGRVTNVVPASGNVRAPIGHVRVATGYDNGAGSVQSVNIRVFEPEAIA